MGSKITTELVPDDAVELQRSYVLDGADRRKIDDQIRACMQHLADSLIRGLHGTNFELDGTSAAVAAGDTIALAGTGVGSTGLTKVTKSTTAVLASAGIAGGIVLSGAPAGGVVRVAIGGVLPPSVTGLATGDAGPVRVNTTTSRCQKVASLGAADYPLGYVDASGYLTVSIFSAVAASGSSTDGAAIHTNVAAEIAGIAEKVAVVGTDILVGEDSENSNAKIKLQVANLPFSSSGVAGLVQYADGSGGFSSETGFAYDAANDRFTVGNQVWSGADSETLLADTHNLAPTNIATIARLTLLNQTGGAINLTGLTGGVVGRLMLLELDPTSDANVVLPVEHTGSITTNRWRASDDVTLTPGAAVLLYYHSATRWLIVGGVGVTSFNSRTGAVVPAASDYDSSQVDDDSTYGGGTQSVAESIDDLKAEIDAISPTDATAIHNNVAGEIAAITAKTTPDNGDQVLIEDSNAANAKKSTSVAALVLSQAPAKTRTLTAGAGMTGGGDLSADRTFDVVANADGSIVVNANDIQVGALATDAQHGVRGGGTQHSVATSGAAGFMPANFIPQHEAWTASATTADNQAASASTLAAAPFLGQWPLVRVGALTPRVGDKTAPCYWSGNSGATARTNGTVASGDKLYWNGSVAGFQLDGTEVLEVVYP